LVDHSFTVREIWLTLRKERREGHSCLYATSLGVPDSQAGVLRNRKSGSGAGLLCKFDLPNAIAAMPAYPFQNTRIASCQACWEVSLHYLKSRIVAGIATPSHAPGAVENLLGAHLRDHVGMRAHEHAAGCDVGQRFV